MLQKNGFVRIVTNSRQLSPNCYQNFEKRGARWFCGICVITPLSVSSKLDNLLTAVLAIPELIKTIVSSNELTYAKILQITEDISAKVTTVCDTATTPPTELTALINITIDLTLRKQSQQAYNVSRRDLNNIIRGIDDSVNLDVYINSLFTDTLHCQVPSKYSKLGKINTNFQVSRRLVKITKQISRGKTNISRKLEIAKRLEPSVPTFL